MSARLYYWSCFVLLAIASLRMAGAWITLTQTYDESFHIACGMEWWSDKRYTRELQHPPLARIAVGALPYAAGERSHHLDGAIEEGNAILGTGEHYWKILALSRAGTLPFFWLFCLSLTAWAHLRFGREAALATMFVSTLLPPLLGHGALATTDMAAAGTLAFAGWRFDAWLRAGQGTRQWWAATLLLGLAVGLAVGSKVSNLLLAPLMAVCIWVFHIRLPRRWWLASVLVGLLAAVTLSGLYRFRKNYQENRADSNRTLAHRIAGLRFFFNMYSEGVVQVRNHNDEGHYSYLLGEPIRTGDWRFFPVVFAVKTPLAVLLLFLIALRFRQARWACLLAFVFLAALLPSKINLGVRHALGVYIGISLAAGWSLAWLWSRQRWAAAALGMWLIGNNFSAHPDYIAWFNELAGNHPERILAESDLDWGQDLHRLLAAMDRRDLQSCNVLYFGTADLEALAPGRLVRFPWEQPRKGCVAVSVRFQTLDTAWATINGEPRPLAWLESHAPVEQVGRSIRLYLLP